MTETKYAGGCHCGKVRYEVKLELTGALACNCSICSKKGSLLTFTAPENFELLSGEGELSDYQWNNKAIHHLFCKTCGVQSFARGVGPQGPMVAINVRCLEGVDLDRVELQPFDGKSLPLAGGAS